jgi:hypothetical protein
MASVMGCAWSLGQYPAPRPGQGSVTQRQGSWLVEGDAGGNVVGWGRPRLGVHGAVRLLWASASALAVRASGRQTKATSTVRQHVILQAISYIGEGWQLTPPQVGEMAETPPAGA